MPQKILIVDDEDAIREEIVEYLGHKGYDCVDAPGAGPALEALHGDTDIGVVLTDLAMPGRNGFELMSTAQSEIDRELEFIVLTGRGGKDAAVGALRHSALRHGAQDFLEKPVDLKHLLHVVQRSELLLQARRTETEKERIGSALGRSVLGAVNAIAMTVEKRDPYTSDHQNRVAQLSVAIVGEMGWSESRIEALRLGAIIHDVGKIYVPSEILNRPGRLTENEFGIIKSHPRIGYEILEKAELPWPIKEMVVQHHERIDGSGYPMGLAGDQIVDEAKVIAVADVVDAMTSHRPYRAALGIEAGLSEIERGKGTAYDPIVVDVCAKLIRENKFRWDRPLAA